MIEINGTYYAKDCIKVIEKVLHTRKELKTLAYYFQVIIVIGEINRGEIIYLETEAEAEQSRKQIIEQLNK